MERNKISIFVQKPIIIPAMLALLSLLLIFWSMVRLVNEVEKFTAKENASNMINAVAVLREYYSNKLLANVKKKHDIIVSPDYLNNPGELPPPARLAIDFAKEISASDINISVRMISKYPFPWRLKNEGMSFDTFEIDALDYLEKNKQDTYFKVEKNTGEKILRYAEPVIMGESCVSCHNSHPDSPKTDWQVGDLRGINEVSIKMTALERTIMRTILFSFLVIAGLIILSLAMLHFSLKRLNRALDDARKKAEELDAINHDLEKIVAQRTAEVSKKNEELSKTIDNLQKAQETIVIQDRLASLGQMTAGIAHEIKNPLNFIKNYSELTSELAEELSAMTAEKLQLSGLLRDAFTDLTADIKRNASKISEHSIRVDEIVKSMLMHSRQGSATAQIVNLNEAVINTVNLLTHGKQLAQNAHQPLIRFNLSEEVKDVELFPIEFGRVIMNVVSNALFAVEQKQEKQPNFQGLIHISTRLVDRHVELSIRDNGCGIAEENLKKIFDPFFTTKPTNQGTGLGLSMAYDLIKKLHHGELTVESRVDEYTDFTIILPLSRKLDN